MPGEPDAGPPVAGSDRGPHSDTGVGPRPAEVDEAQDVEVAAELSGGSDNGPLLTWPLALLAGVAMVVGFTLGRQLLEPAAGSSPTRVPAATASGTQPAPLSGDTDGLSVGLDWGDQATLGRASPPFTLPGPNGETVSLDDFSGRPIVLNFFATWCGPCRVEMPHLQVAWERYKDVGLVVLAVDVQEAPETVGPFLAELGLTFPIAVDQDGKVSDLYRIGILPTTYFIDREGVIARHRVGVIAREEDLAAELAYIIPEAVQAPPSPTPSR